MFLLFWKNKFTVKELWLKIFAYILIWVLFIYVINSLFYGIQLKYKDVDIYDYCNYDIEVYGSYAENYDDIIAGQAFIENDLKFANSIGTSLFFNGEDCSVSILSLVGKDFDNLFKMFSKEFFVEFNESLISKSDCMLLSYSVARTLKADIGDSIDVSGKSKVVAGIYADAIVTVIGANVFILEDEPADFYNKVLIQVSDVKTAKEYFEDNYFNHNSYIDFLIGNEYHLPYIEEYGDKWIHKAIDEVAGNDTLTESYKSQSFKFKNALKIYAEASHKAEYTLNKDIAYSVVSIIVVFSICILESYRHAKENQQKIAILRMMGCSRYSISFFYFARSFILQTIIMLCGFAFEKSRNDAYVSNTLMVQWIMYFEIVIFIAALISTAVSMGKLSDKALLFSLNEEGSED